MRRSEYLGNLFPAALLVDEETRESRVLWNGDFEILGAAIGCSSFCNDLAEEKVNKASKLLNEIAKLEDPQVASRLLRNCAGVCKITHCMRTTPSHLHQDALRQFDKTVQSTFSASTCLAPDEAQWAQTCRGFKQAGLGFRSAVLHGEAAFLASLCASRDKCRELLPAFTLNADAEGSEFATNLAAYNAKLPADKRYTPQDILGCRQQSLSHTLDEAGHEKRLAEVCMTDQATLRSECEPGAKDFFQVVPSKSLGFAVPAAEFIVEVRYRLCMTD